MARTPSPAETQAYLTARSATRETADAFGALIGWALRTMGARTVALLDVAGLVTAADRAARQVLATEGTRTKIGREHRAAAETWLFAGEHREAIAQSWADRMTQ